MKTAPRPYRNQRLYKPKQKRQQQILEVSIRRDQERAQRLRRSFWLACKALLVIAAGVGLVWGSRAGIERFIWKNPSFYLTDVRVSTEGTLTREQILTAAAITVGQNIFTVDLSKVHKALDRLPQVERVEVHRYLPRRLDIEITERQPIAWVTEKAETDATSSESALLIDARGYVMKSRKIPLDYFHLPTISGVVTENLALGQKVNSLEMQAALDLIRLNADSTRWQVRNIDIAKGYCLVVTDRTHAQITFGLDDVDRQLSRLNRLLDYVEPSHREIQTVNLLVERNTPVTFVDPNAPVAEGPVVTPPPPPTPPPVKPEKPTASKGSKEKQPSPAPKSSSGGKKTPPDNVRKPFRMNG